MFHNRFDNCLPFFYEFILRSVNLGTKNIFVVSPAKLPNVCLYLPLICVVDRGNKSQEEHSPRCRGNDARSSREEIKFPPLSCSRPRTTDSEFRFKGKHRSIDPIFRPRFSTEETVFSSRNNFRDYRSNRFDRF